MRKRERERERVCERDREKERARGGVKRDKERGDVHVKGILRCPKTVHLS